MSLCFMLFLGLLRESVCTEWTAQLPETISAVEGSCVVIPCAFTYPKGVEASITAVWYTSRSIFQSLVVYNGEDPLKVDARFLGRAFLIGNLTSGDCALKIDKVKTTDGQHYYVSFHAKGQKFRFQDQKVTLSVSSKLSGSRWSGVCEASREGCLSIADQMRFFHQQSVNCFVVLMLYMGICIYHLPVKCGFVSIVGGHVVLCRNGTKKNAGPFVLH